MKILVIKDIMSEEDEDKAAEKNLPPSIIKALDAAEKRLLERAAPGSREISYTHQRADACNCPGVEFAREAEDEEIENIAAALKRAVPLCPITVADVQNEEFAKAARETRERCAEERREVELRSSASGGGLMNMITAAMGQPPELKWRKISIAIDSGAAETVIPHTLVPEYPITDTERSRSGLCYASATGQPIPNLGEQRLPLATREGSLRMMALQAAPVAKALGSVAKICKAGHQVVFDEEGSYIVNKVTGEVNWLREEHGNYLLDVWIPPNVEGNLGMDCARLP